MLPTISIPILNPLSFPTHSIIHTRTSSKLFAKGTVFIFHKFYARSMQPDSVAFLDCLLLHLSTLGAATKGTTSFSSQRKRQESHLTDRSKVPHQVSCNPPGHPSVDLEPGRYPPPKGVTTGWAPQGWCLYCNCRDRIGIGYSILTFCLDQSGKTEKFP